MDETNVTPAGLPTAGSPEERVQRAFERVSNAPLREGNRLSLLKNGPQTYDEWLEEIRRAKKWIHLENYIFRADGVGRRFAEALKEKVAEGVPVCASSMTGTGPRPRRGCCGEGPERA